MEKQSADAQDSRQAVSLDDYVPMELWGKDHWSTLAYIETVMVDCGGFQIGVDARMKTGRRNTLVMRDGCPRPKRAQGIATIPMVMRPEHSTKLRDGTQIPGHDDWACVQDMANAGLFTFGPERVEPRATLRLSQLGQSIVGALRAHKALGRPFSTFTPSGATKRDTAREQT